MRFLYWLIGFIIIAQITAFAVLNRDVVSITWNPLGPPVTLPLYAVALAFVTYGFLVGSFIVWVSGHQARRTARKQRKIIKTLEKELQHNQQESPAQPQAHDFFPALPASIKS